MVSLKTPNASKSRLFTLLIVFLFSASDLLGQTKTLHGKVVDANGHPIENANIFWGVLSGGRSGSIKGFTQTDKNGQFNLALNQSPQDSFYLTASRIGYQDSTILTKIHNGDYNLKLKVKAKSLETVVVKAALPITKRGDTISYNIDVFKSVPDRVIGDVIQKLPGIEMRGKSIYYDGKPLQKYYINGLDALDGRYNLANDNLPVDAVKKVQIIENDQPIKILDSLIHSDQASLNVVLKKYSTTGTARIGIGACPLLWDLSLTPMVFNKNYQLLSTFQSNNTGQDLNEQLKDYAGRSAAIHPDFIPSLLSIQEPEKPPFGKDRWMRNRSNLFSTSFIRKLANDLQIKTSLAFVNDYQKADGEIKSSIYTGRDSVNVLERIVTKSNLNKLLGAIEIEKNSSHMYFKDKVAIQAGWIKQNGHDNRNDTLNIGQKLHSHSINFGNNFNSHFKIGNQLLGFNQEMEYAKSPQNLEVAPGQFKDILNDSIPYSALDQFDEVKRLKVKSYISMEKIIKLITSVTNIGTYYEKLNIRSNISSSSNEQEFHAVVNDFAKNDFEFSDLTYFINQTFQYNQNRWNIQVQLPLNWMHKKLDYQKTYLHTITYKKPIFNPSVDLHYQLNAKYKISYSFNYDKVFTDVSAMNTGYILRTYSNLQKSKIDELLQYGNYVYHLDIDYKNILNGLFANLAIEHRRIENNFIESSSVNNQGITVTQWLPKNNAEESNSIVLSLSKYYDKLRSTIKFKPSIELKQSFQYINETFLRLKGYNISTIFQLNNNSLSFLDLNYQTEVRITSNTLSGNKLNNIFQQVHKLSLNVITSENYIFSLLGEYYYNRFLNTNKQLLTDFKFTYKIPKRDLDIECRLNNIFNVRYYNNIYQTANIIYSNQFQIRPRQFIISCLFNFK